MTEDYPILLLPNYTLLLHSYKQVIIYNQYIKKKQQQHTFYLLRIYWRIRAIYYFLIVTRAF